MRKPVEFTDACGLQSIIVERENGDFGIKTYMNGFTVNLQAYDLTKTYLEGLQKAIGEFLGQNKA